MGRGKGTSQSEGELAFQRESSFSPNNLSDPLQDETKTWIKMDSWWARSQPDRDCLDVLVFGPLSKLWSHFQTPKVELEAEVAGPLCPSSQCGHIEWSPFSAFHVPFDSFNWLVMDWWLDLTCTQAMNPKFYNSCLAPSKAQRNGVCQILDYGLQNTWFQISISPYKKLSCYFIVVTESWPHKEIDGHPPTSWFTVEEPHPVRDPFSGVL